ncbi:S8 family serine peptidase [Spirulina sp. CCNP1310]|uniref:S8 family serine peptidase n=1 Tax=Spirulina sp. CCNP1310 TaxID=3110249 RepID=UPI002B1F2463|nr:S8 family serine peptidase [Spirulina sp. CCNP1310]MEA5417828.1 S8 family serine peptidase [Spirulina sp. CCNP1310]
MAKSRRSSQFKVFILEPILTPSSFIDTGVDEVHDGVDAGLEVYDLPTDTVEILEPVEPQESTEAVEVVPEEMTVSGLEREIEIIDYIDPLFLTESVDPNVGVFTVDDSSYVSIDYLFDGGKYSQGELAIFSLEGMTEEPGSQAFIQEAARRVLSNSSLGHVVISDATDGALFSTTTSVDVNTGEYQGIQHFKMNAGDRFAFIFSPNHSIQQVYDGEAWRPLFSMAIANRDQVFQVGEINDIASEGMVLAFEDISVAGGRSDRDYNDLILHVRGATGDGPAVEDVIAEGRNIERGLPWAEIVDYLGDPPVLELPVLGANVIYSDRFFNPTESFSLIGMVDRVDAVDRVEVWVKGFGEKWRPLGNVEDFSAEGHYRFEHRDPLDAGHYEVKAIAFYPGGEAEAITPITVLSLDKGVELSDQVKAALLSSVDLSSYDPSVLAQTTDWVVSVRSDTDLEALATQLGIAGFEPTGILANTYRVDFGSNLSATEVQALLHGIDGIEYGLPLIEHQVNYYSPTNDPLVNNQWYLNQGGIAHTWTNHGVSGQGITMGIVDSGFLTNHPDLAGNYRTDLSWNYDENNNNPSSAYKETLAIYKDHPYMNFTIVDSQPQTIHANSDNFYQLSSGKVSGKVQNAVLNFTLQHQAQNSIELFLYQYNTNGSLSEHYATVSLPSGGNINTGSYSIDLTEKVKGWSAEKPWGVYIKDLNPNDTKSGILDDLSLDIITFNDHGTAVAGIATAVGNNSIGITGVAPNAQWAGIRVGTNITDLTLKNALTHQLDNIDLYSSSWGLGLFTHSFLALQALEQAARTHGTPYIFSGGNKRDQGYNVNYGAFANSSYTIAVGAVDHTGKVADYSAPGSSLFISAYSSGSGKGMTTTDVDGTYRNNFGGTSAAAPVVSGVVALLMEANPDLNWRDIQHILARSADRTAINDPNAQWSGSEGDAIRHSHDYGFGLVNPVKALSLAKSWEPLPPVVTISGGLVIENKKIEYDTLVSSKIMIDQQIKVESVEVLLNFDHEYLGDLEIVLISPSGERSILTEQHGGADASKRYAQGQKYFWPFSSFHHWGELSKGEWKLEILDKDYDSDGFLRTSEIRIKGIELTPRTVGENFQVARHENIINQNITPLSNGNFLVSWLGDYYDYAQDDYKNVVGRQIYNNKGQPIGQELYTSFFPWDEDHLLDAVPLEDGGFLVVKQKGLDLESSIFVQRYDQHGEKVDNELKINSLDGASYPSIVISDSGEFLIIWDQNLGKRGRKYDSQGNPIGEELIIQGSEPIAFLENNRLISTWVEGGVNSDSSNIYGQIYDHNLNPVNSEFTINTSLLSDRVKSSLLQSTSYDFTISWFSENQDHFNLYLQKYDYEGNPIGEELFVDTYMSVSQNEEYYPQITSLDNGDFIVTSISTHDNKYKLYGQRYSKQGEKLGKKFLINTRESQSEVYDYGNFSEKNINKFVTASKNGKILSTWGTSITFTADPEYYGVNRDLDSGDINPLDNRLYAQIFSIP